MDKRLKVLYHFSGSGSLTGSPRALVTMIESLDRDRFVPLFLGSAEGPLADELRANDVEILNAGVNSVSWRTPLLSLRQVREKRRLLDQHAINIVHMNEAGWNSDLVLAASTMRIPVALHLHNPATVHRSNLNYLLARKVFLCSKAQADQVKNFEAIASRSVVLHNAVDIDHFASGHPIRRELGLKTDEIVIGTVAQVGHRKGSDLFLDAAERVLASGKNVTFLMVGPQAVGEADYFQTIMNRLQKDPLKGRVHYLGGRRDVPDLLSSFDVFFLPTRAEPFGMVIIEAMAAGVPVVATAVGGIPEIVTSDEIGCLVQSSDSSAFAGALIHLIEMGEARKTLGERGKKSLYGRFDLASMSNTLSSIYNEMSN